MEYYIVVPVLVFLSVMGIGGAVAVARWERQKTVQARLRSDPLDDALTQAGPEPLHWTHWMARFGRVLSGGKPTRNLEEQLAHAGYHGPSAAPVFVGAKVLLLALGALAFTATLWRVEIDMVMRLTMIAAGAALLSFVPNLVLDLQRKRRRREIRQNLPNAVDLLEICVTSGMGLQMAWNSVAEEIRMVSPTLADEMALTNLETHLGASTATAMRHMSERTGTQELSTLTAVLVQSERFGTSIGDALRVFADGLRQTRSQKAQEAAERMAVKLLFPMVLFMFPAVMVVMAGPAVLQLIDGLGQM